VFQRGRLVGLRRGGALMARVHRGFTVGRRSPGRLTQWIGPADQGFVSVAAAGATLMTSVVFEEPLTVVRIRGHMTIIPDSTAADVSIVGAFGMGIVSAEASAAGIVSIPEPFSDADWGGWMLWRSFAMRFESITQAGVLLANWAFELDSKAMRKMSPNEVLVAVVESQSGAFAISVATRVLLKLS